MATAPATCPSCGAIVPPKIALSRTGRRIFDAVKAHPGILAENLRDIVWADDPSGGPESRHAIYAHVFILQWRSSPTRRRPCSPRRRHRSCTRCSPAPAIAQLLVWAMFIQHVTTTRKLMQTTETREEVAGTQ
jgi:hypothetical protein